MRRRIVLTNVAVSAITLLIFSILVVWISATRVVDAQAHTAKVDANRLARGVDARIEGNRPLDAIDLEGFVTSDTSIVVRLEDGRTLPFGTRTDRQRISATSDVPGPATVTVHTHGDTFVTAAFRVGLILLALGLIAIGAAALIARRLANTLVEPMRDLALTAARLGSGDARPSRRRYGIAELDAVAEVLDTSAERIGQQVADERRLAADASHQLRTPLTALSMRLEEVLATDDPAVVRAEAAIALTQVERLSGVVDDLLGQARHSDQTDVDVDSVLVQQLEEWRGAYNAQDRAMRISGAPGLTARVSAGVLGQVVATLIENALLHGAGATSVRTRTAGGLVVIEVSDEGDGVPADLARHIFDREVSGASRSGIGLAVARALTEAKRRLELIHPRPATFALFLAPGSPEEGEAGEQPVGTDERVEASDGQADVLLGDAGELRAQA